MAWEDRPHYRDRRGASTNPLSWLLSGSVRMFSLFGVEFRAHSSLIIFAVWILLPFADKGYPLGIRAFSIGLWVLTVFLHELAHCAAARRLGGCADEVMLWPAGGLIAAEPPNRPGPTFFTAFAGPLFNLLLCVGSGIGVYVFTPTVAAHALSIAHQSVPLNPFHGPVPDFACKWSDPAFYCWWIFFVNYRLLLLNLLPIYPLDGGRMLQAMLWPMVGNFRSTLIEANVGIAGSVGVGLVALACQGWFLAAAMMCCCFQAYQRRVVLHETGPEDWSETFDFSGSLLTEEKPRRRRRLSRRVIRRARKIAQMEKAARDRIDAILAKVSARGMPSLNWRERRALRKATAKHQRTEDEISRFQ
jgi:stage IV sporulation protein FB